MELMCDRVGIIANGRLLGVKPVNELIMQAQGNQRVMRYTVNDLPAALKVVGDNRLEPFNVNERSFDVAVESDEQLGRLGIALASAGIWVLEVTRQGQHLEDVFIEITGGGDQIA
jgi:ABC-2 type transport system ATP-binding protein